MKVRETRQKQGRKQEKRERGSFRKKKRRGRKSEWRRVQARARLRGQNRLWWLG